MCRLVATQGGCHLAERHSAGVFIILFFHHPAVRVTFHHLVDELLLDTKAVVGCGIQCPLHAVSQHMHRLVPRGIQVALPKDTSVPLLKVHRTKRGIHMVQGKQTVLHVHADTHFLGTAQEDAHVSVPNFLKQGFAAVSVIVVHDDNLLGWYAGCYQFLFHIFIEIKAGDIRVIVKQVHLRTFPRRLIAIAEYKLRALVRCAFLIEFYNVAHDLVRLAVRIVRIARIQQPQVDGCLLGLGEHDQRQRALLALGLPGQFVIILQFTHQHVHHVLQVLVLVNDDVLHFPVSQFGDIFILLELLHVIRQPGFLHFGQITGTIVERFQVRTDGITQISNHGLGIFRELSGPFFNMIHGHFRADGKNFRVNAHIHLATQLLLHTLLQFGIAFIGDEAIT